MHSHPEILGSKIHEWDAATKGKHLPEHVKTYDSGGKVPQKDHPMAGIFDSLVKTVKGKADAIKAGNKEVEGMGAELAARSAMNRAGEAALSEPKATPEAPRTGTGVGGTKSPYGTRAGEKRIDTSGMSSDNIKAYDKGGKVNVNDGKHEVAILKHGERVLTEKQDKAYQKMKNHGEPDTDDVKVYDKGGKVAAGMFDQITKGGDKPKKEIHQMVHTKTHNGKHVVTHKHHSPSHHPDETHMFNNMDEVKDHMDAHAGTDPAAGAAPMTAAPSPMPPAGGAPAPAGM
jgi:hypothetical protein